MIMIMTMMMTAVVMMRTVAGTGLCEILSVQTRPGGATVHYRFVVCNYLIIVDLEI